MNNVVQTLFLTMLCNQIESWSRMSTVKHCSGSQRITSWYIMRMISCARHGVGGFLIASFTGVVHQSHCRTWCMQRFTCGYPLCSNVKLIAHHIMHISSSAWHCTGTSCAFLSIGTHHIIPIVRTQNMMVIVFWVYPSFKKNPDLNCHTSHTVIEQTKWKKHE